MEILFFSMKSILRNMKLFKFDLLFFILFNRLSGNFGFLCPNMENLYDSDYPEFSGFDAQVVNSEEFVHDVLGLNFESDSSQSETDNFKDSVEMPADFPTFRSSKSLLDFRQNTKNNVQIIENSYQSVFDRTYSGGFNYSQVFRGTTNRRLANHSITFTSTNYTYTSFPSLYEIYEYLAVLEQLGEDRAMVIPLKVYNDSWKIVHTNFGNEILSIRISPKPLEVHSENSIIVVVAGIHGRDWYAVQSAIFLATDLIRNGHRINGRDLDWWIVPVLNPDGYEISQTGSKWRNWEKNLFGAHKIESDECFGLDLDFNFEYQWLSCDESPCNSNYPGEIPFISPETRGLRDTLEAFSEYCDSFVALKEGRQLLVYPFADTPESPRHVDGIEIISKKAVEAFRKHVDEIYDYGQSSHKLDTRAGFIEDWAKIHLGIEKSFAFYLGPTTKDRRELKSQHLMDHMNGTLDLLKVIAHETIHEKTQNSSNKPCPLLINIVLIFIIIR